MATMRAWIVVGLLVVGVLLLALDGFILVGLGGAYPNEIPEFFGFQVQGLTAPAAIASAACVLVAAVLAWRGLARRDPD
jgi:membrane protein implicated in regulation of membrane protease activity